MFRKVHPRLISNENAEEKKIRQAFKMETDLQKLREISREISAVYSEPDGAFCNDS